MSLTLFAAVLAAQVAPDADASDRLTRTTQARLHGRMRWPMVWIMP